MGITGIGNTSASTVTVNPTSMDTGNTNNTGGGTVPNSGGGSVNPNTPQTFVATGNFGVDYPPEAADLATAMAAAADDQSDDGDRALLETDILNNDTDIANNATDIAANQTAIVSNANDIFTNAADIVALQTSVSQLQTAAPNSHYHDVQNPTGTNTNLFVPLSTGLSTTNPSAGAGAQTSGPAGSTAVGHSHSHTHAPADVPHTHALNGVPGTQHSHNYYHAPSNSYYSSSAAIPHPHVSGSTVNTGPAQ